MPRTKKTSNTETKTKTKVEASQIIEEDEADLNREQIRLLVSSFYDLQKVKIAVGNRLVSNFYKSLGIKPSESPKKRTNEDDFDRETKSNKKVHRKTCSRV